MENRLHIYSPVNNARIQYIFREIFTELLGLEFIVISDHEAFRQLETAKFEYQAQCTDPLRWGETGEGDDVFQQSFRLLTRMEEYGSVKTDIHGRVCFSEYIQKPLVNIWAEEIKSRLAKEYPQLKFRQNKFSIYATIDIDNAWCFREKGIVRNAGAAMKDIFQLRIAHSLTRLFVLSGLREDPFEVFNWIIAFHKQKNILLHFFWLLADRGVYDKNIHFRNAKQKKLIQKIAKEFKVGIHPSYYTFNNNDKLKMEKERLEDILNDSESMQEVKSSRQHFLRMSLPETYRNLIAAGITEDHTMGYADSVGFRAGICTPFKWFDLERNEETTLKIVPFAAMDVTLKTYMKLSPEEAVTCIHKLMDEVRKVNGPFVTLWHNESLSNYGEWKGWRSVYESMTKKIKE